MPARRSALGLSGRPWPADGLATSRDRTSRQPGDEAEFADSGTRKLRAFAHREGSVDLNGWGRRVGRGYVEMTGHGDGNRPPL